jgi:hypothetical integral membrane protein (TIGR02206 family)
VVNRFVLFGADHLAALAAIAVASVVATMIARRTSGAAARALRYGLALLLLLVTAATVAYWLRRGALPLDLLPFHLCDFLIFVAAFALLTLERTSSELLYFWAASGTIIAMLGPDLLSGFPSWAFVSFFLLHGLVVVAAAVVVFGFRRTPRDGAPLRVFALTNAYALVVGLVNLALGTNFLFLRGKPQGRTLLDLFGPWPVYLFVGEAVALGLFLLLDLPFRSARKGSRSLLHARPPLR